MVSSRRRRHGIPILVLEPLPGFDDMVRLQHPSLAGAPAMTPTVLTVFTRASAGASSKLPLVN